MSGAGTAFADSSCIKTGQPAPDPWSRSLIDIPLENWRPFGSASVQIFYCHDKKLFSICLEKPSAQQKHDAIEHSRVDGWDDCGGADLPVG
jgi:hypothetical protein